MSELGLRFPGRPEDIEAAGREIGRTAQRLRTASRLQARGGAEASRIWHGTASVQFAARSGSQVRQTSTAGDRLDDVRREALAFGGRLRRIQREATTALTERDRLKQQLADALRDQRWLRTDPAAAQGVDAEIRDLRKRIAAHENTLANLHRDLRNEKKRFGDRLLGMVPPEMVQWWKDCAGTKDFVAGAKSMKVPGQSLIQLLPALRNHRKALLAGDAKGAKAASTQIDDALRRIQQAASGRLGRVAAGAPGGTSKGAVPRVIKVTDQKQIQRFLRSPAGKLVQKAGPAGTVFTVKDGVTDAATGGGKDGAQGWTTRGAGVAMAGGAVLMLFPPTAVAGGVVLAGALLTKAAMKMWDNRQAVGRNLRRVFGLMSDSRQQKPPRIKRKLHPHELQYGDWRQRAWGAR